MNLSLFCAPFSGKNAHVQCMALGLVHGGACGAQVVIGCREAGLAADHPDACDAGHGVHADLIGGREGGGNLSGPVGCTSVIDRLKQAIRGRR